MGKWDESSRWDARKFSRHYLGPQPAAVNDLIGEAYRIGFRAGLEEAVRLLKLDGWVAPSRDLAERIGKRDDLF